MKSYLLDTAQQEILQKLLSNNKKTLFRKCKSFYIHGKTGCGKTTVMEQFLLELHKSKTAVNYLAMHFHDYLLDITKLMVQFTLKEIAGIIAKKAQILCFDEFFIETIADAKILYDLFLELIKNGTCIIVTSNFAPENLYHNGFNRQIMFPLFSDFINQKMEVIHIHNTTDYRFHNSSTYAQISFNTLEDFAKHFNVETTIQKEEILVDSNHTTEIVGKFQGGALLNYSAIFQRHSSINDYRRLARTFAHIHICNMQKFTSNNEDEAIRFRNFIDILYTRGMIISFDGITDISVFEESMLKNIKFKRCESRLYEMQTEEYIYSKTKEFKRKLTIDSAKFFEEII